MEDFLTPAPLLMKKCSKETFCSAVQPDPPVSLNWTLLNVSLTGNYYDILLSWKPPPSSGVETGWMKLQYEVQHRDNSSSVWEMVGVS